MRTEITAKKIFKLTPVYPCLMRNGSGTVALFIKENLRVILASAKPTMIGHIDDEADANQWYHFTENLVLCND